MKKDELEPGFWDFNRDGLYCGWFDQKPIKKNEIDIAMKKALGKDWNKPLYPKRRDFFRK